jgi:Peptidase family M28
MSAACLISIAAILAHPQESRPAGIQEKVAGMIQEKVAGMIQEIDAAQLKRTIGDLVGFGTRHVASATDSKERGTGAARTYLEARLRSFIPQSGGRLSVARETFKRMNRRIGGEVQVVNIVATLRGTADPERVYVVGGHYDSRNSDGRDGEHDAPGANDDGSGTAAVVELCRIMSRREFAATIKFVCYDGEEVGLVGSTAHARALAADDVAVDGMITNDIVGNTLGVDGVQRKGYLRCFSYAATGNDSTSRSLARAATRAAREHVSGLEVKLIYRGDRYGRGGDHKSFHAEGYPSIRFTEPREDYSRQHQNVTMRDGKAYGDVLEYVDFDYLTNVTAVNVALLSELASAPPPPRSTVVAGLTTSYAVRVSWTPVPGVERYEVVWRQTTAPDWEHQKLIDQPQRGRRGLQALLPDVCLDDVVVGVRSVGKDGSRSRVTTPPEPDRFNLRPATGRKQGR